MNIFKGYNSFIDQYLVELIEKLNLKSEKLEIFIFGLTRYVLLPCFIMFLVAEIIPLGFLLNFAYLLYKFLQFYFNQPTQNYSKRKRKHRNIFAEQEWFDNMVNKTGSDNPEKW